MAGLRADGQPDERLRATTLHAILQFQFPKDSGAMPMAALGCICTDRAGVL
jgi:hypothetical protein